MSTKPSNFRGTASRNDDSVLFSLDNLAKLAPSAAPLRPKPATAAPASEGSGLIEIRTIGAILQREAPPRSGAPEDGIPGFGGSGFDGLSAAPLVSETPVLTPVVKPAPRPSNAPIYVLLGLLGSALLGLGAMMVLDDPEPPVIVTEYVTAPETDTVEPPPADEAEAEPSESEPAPVEPEAKADPKPESKPTSAPRRRNRSTPAKDQTPVTTTKAAPQPPEPDVDCLINPNLDKCRAKQPKATKPKPETKPDPGEELANKLGQAEILAGIGPVKTAAKSCGSGTTVEVKFSVAGASGRVISADAQGEHASSTVGRCVTRAAKSASFERFAAKQQGFTFKFRL